MKKWIYIILTASLSFVLTACGDSIPDLTAEEELAISEYAVELVTKYSKNGNNRLEDISELDETTIEESMALLASMSQEEEEEVIEDEEVFDEIEEVAEPAEESNVIEEIEVPVYSSMRIDQILGVDGVEITYAGSDIMDTYEPGENSYFSITASRGKKLVVNRFNISNVSGSALKIDMGQYDVKYAYGNGADSKKKKLDHTVTAKDIYSYQGYLEAGQSDTLIGIAEMVESEIPSITEPTLSVKYMGESSLILLQ